MSAGERTDTHTHYTHTHTHTHTHSTETLPGADGAEERSEAVDMMQRLVLLYGLRTNAVLTSVLQQLVPAPKDVQQVPRNDPCVCVCLCLCVCVCVCVYYIYIYIYIYVLCVCVCVCVCIYI